MFGVTSLAQLQGLTIKFDSYKEKPNHTIRQHLRILLDMIRDLTTTNHHLIYEQQVQVIIQFLLQTYE